MSSKRILKELNDLQTNPPDGVTISLPPSQDMHTWHITLRGPPSTPYESGTFAIIARLPVEYPFKPPTVRFATRVYHPNVTNDSAGNVCLGLLKSEHWKPSLQMRAVVEALRALLAEPAPDDALEGTIAEEFRSQREVWEGKVRESVKLYASGEVVFKDAES